MTVEVNKERLISLYNEHKSLRAVGRILGTDHHTIKRKLALFDIPYLAPNRHVHDDIFFSKESERAFYWAGFIAADGAIIQKGSCRYLQLILSNKDHEHLVTFKNHIGTTANVYTYCYKDKISKIDIYSQTIVNDLIRFNVVPRKTFTYDFPRWLVDHHLVSHFMRGYFDGDGSTDLNGGQRRFSIRGNKFFLQNYANILNKNCEVGINKICKSGGQYQLQYHGNIKFRKISDFLYTNATVFLNRKRRDV